MGKAFSFSHAGRGALAKLPAMCVRFWGNGRCGIRTHRLCLRRATLYPNELIFLKVASRYTSPFFAFLSICMERIILASSSPQRAAILKNLNIPFAAMSSHGEECIPDSGDAGELARLNAGNKLNAALGILRQSGSNERANVLSADTLVGQAGRLFGKPKSRDDAAAMLRTFSGNTCEIATAISFYNGKTRKASSRLSLTKVSFMELGDAQIEKYLDTGEWQGAAGGFRIQGVAACFIVNLQGSYSGAVGLPVHLLYELLLENDCGFVV